MPAQDALADTRRIGVVRANAIGDFVFCLPALQALRSAYPRAEMVLLARPWHAELLDGRPGPVDRVAAMPPIPGVGVDPGTPHDASLIPPFVERMRAERFDILMQMHGGGRHSNALVRRIGARLTAGLHTPDAEPLDRSIPFVYWQHEYFRYLEIASLVGAVAADVAPHLAVTQRDVDESLRALSADGRPLAVLHPGATDVRRRWPVERFAAVGDALAGAGCTVCVVGSGDDAEAAAAVCRAMVRPAVSLAGALSLRGLVGLLSRAALLLGDDSGPLHLAVAVGTPTVGVFWCGNLLNGGPLTRARHRPLVAWRQDCPVCGAGIQPRGCGHDACIVDEVALDEVRGAALDLLAAVADRRAPVAATP